MKHIGVAIAVLMILCAASAQTGKPSFAGPPVSDGQVFRASDVRSYDGYALTGDAVYINLPVRVSVVVTYSIDMFEDSALFFGLKVNDGECSFGYGPAGFSSEKIHANTVQWVVTKDEVSFGTNRFEPCVMWGTGRYDLRTLTVMRPR